MESHEHHVARIEYQRPRRSNAEQEVSKIYLKCKMTCLHAWKADIERGVDSSAQCQQPASREKCCILLAI